MAGQDGRSRALPTTAREALLLVATEGLSHAEAAAVCGISREALRQRLSRARSLLAKELDEMATPRAKRLKEVS